MSNLKLMLKAGAKIDECRQHLFNKGFSYHEANSMVMDVFEKGGSKNFQEQIDILHNKFLK